MIKKALTAVALVAAFATSASAATVIVSANKSTGVVSGFGTDIGAATWSQLPGVVSGSVGGKYRSPYDEGIGGTTEYFTVGSPDLPQSPAILRLTSAKNSFMMLWGSLDDYNAVTFCFGETCDTVSGVQVRNATMNASSGVTNSIVTFSSDFYFDTVFFRSDFNRAGDQAAFEFALAPVPVPLPAGGLLLLGALGGIAALRRRKAV
ncbi:MAG: VPLPA-CTERM sorting domain-containing protein [Rhodobacteraceae bacterium]|nr:VPLPA-CTERM sorting domain-containing protein [Paracoccaceae bacterium]